jgi:drug/metabolite transporter (DMT)-like permease
MLNELLLLTSEVVLSAYPLLIKLVDASVIFQTGLRMVVYAGLALIAAYTTGSPLVATHIMSSESLATGLLNLLHVFTSYTAFEQLAGGNAMALFYTYPVWNILGAAAVLKEALPLTSLPWIGLALAGAIALAQPTTTNWTTVGIISALLAAITESGIYLWFRMKDEGESDQPWTKMIQMYGSSGLLWAVGIAIMAGLGLLAAGTFKISGKGLASIVAFNSLIGFVGYALRFYLIPKVSTVAFSALSFFGIISAYVFGWVFSNETPTMLQIAGAIAIIIANTVLVNKETV